MDPAEHFAESFTAYHFDRAAFKAAHPDSFNMVEFALRERGML
jgi:hypothetical protein